MTRRSQLDLLRFEDVAPLSLGCSGCPDRSHCGGRHVPGDIFSCTDACDSGTCRPGCISPKHPEPFNHAYVRVGGFGFDNLGTILCPKRLPDAIAVLQHGSLLKRCRAAQSALKWAAVPMRCVIRFPKRGRKDRPAWREVFKDGGALRRAFGLDPSTRIVLSCVDKDERIEPVWRDYNQPGFMAYFRRLDLAAVIPPNFSLFDHEPRTQHQYNRKRSLILAEEFSRFGIPVIPNFHAIGPGDRDFWREFLQSRPEITCLAEEFQTGLRHPRRAEATIDELSRLQDQLRRPIHLVAIGASRLKDRIEQRFSSHTMVSSQPFLLAVNGMRMQERPDRTFGRIRDDGDRGQLLLHNVRLLARLSRGNRRSTKVRTTFRRCRAHSLTGAQRTAQPGLSTATTTLNTKPSSKVPRAPTQAPSS